MGKYNQWQEIYLKLKSYTNNAHDPNDVTQSNGDDGYKGLLGTTHKTNKQPQNCANRFKDLIESKINFSAWLKFKAYSDGLTCLHDSEQRDSFRHHQLTAT